MSKTKNLGAIVGAIMAGSLLATPALADHDCPQYSDALKSRADDMLRNGDTERVIETYPQSQAYYACVNSVLKEKTAGRFEYVPNTRNGSPVVDADGDPTYVLRVVK